jgi:DNA-binding winged helix-turn-helix (wHTH) protein
VAPGDVTAATQLAGWPPPSGRPEATQEHAGAGSAPPWDEQVPPPGRDATLLAVVPIPGTGTSLAIVGYAIATSAAPPGSPPDGAAAPAGSPATPHAVQPSSSGLRLDHVQRRVWTDGDEVQLTFQEYELLAFLTAHPATVFTRADLVDQVWHHDLGDGGQPVPRDSRTVDVHVSRLRHKLGPRYGQCLVTEYRVGYQFRPLPP